MMSHRASLDRLPLEIWSELGLYLQPWHLARLWKTGSKRVVHYIENSSFQVSVTGRWNNNLDASAHEWILEHLLHKSTMFELSYFQPNFERFFLSGAASRLRSLKIAMTFGCVMPVGLVDATLMPELRHFSGGLSVATPAFDQQEEEAAAIMPTPSFPPWLKNVYLKLFVDPDRETENTKVVLRSLQALRRLKTLRLSMVAVTRRGMRVEQQHIWDEDVVMPSSVTDLCIDWSDSNYMPFLDRPGVILPSGTLLSLRLPKISIRASLLAPFTLLETLQVGDFIVDVPIPCRRLVRLESGKVHLSGHYSAQPLQFFIDMPRTLQRMDIRPLLRLIRTRNLPQIDEAIGHLPVGFEPSDYGSVAFDLYNELQVRRMRHHLPNIISFCQKHGIMLHNYWDYPLDYCPDLAYLLHKAAFGHEPGANGLLMRIENIRAQVKVTFRLRGDDRGCKADVRDDSKNIQLLHHFADLIGILTVDGDIACETVSKSLSSMTSLHQLSMRGSLPKVRDLLLSLTRSVHKTRLGCYNTGLLTIEMTDGSHLGQVLAEFKQLLASVNRVTVITRECIDEAAVFPSSNDSFIVKSCERLHVLNRHGVIYLSTIVPCYKS